MEHELYLRACEGVDWNYSETFTDPWVDYCDYCEREGHTFRSCPARDDDPDYSEEDPDA
jgi:hypothetical protein